MLAEPWARVPAVEIPSGNLAEALGGMPDDELEALIQANLLPRDPKDRRRWEVLWGIISGSPQLTDRVGDIVEAWLDTCEEAVEAGRVDERGQKRITKFVTNCEAALDRLDQPLAWLGPRARQFNPAARKLIDELVQAIDLHRTNTVTPSDQDQHLWQVLTALNLDPDDVQIGK